MADFSACNRTIKRQLFRKNGTIRILLLIFLILFMIAMYQHLSCDGMDELREQDTNSERVIMTSYEQTSPHIKLRENIFLFIMVLTAPNGQERRAALRKTWLSNVQTLGTKVVVKFIIGGGMLNEEESKILEDENKLYGDILLLPNVNDSYSQLTNKVLQTMRWIDQNINCVFVLKVDDDTFVRLDSVVSELKSSSSAKTLYWGFFRGDAHVKSKGSWLENNWNLCDRYLPYAQGGGYIISSDLVHFIARNSDLLKIFNSEDVSVGTWLAPLQVNRVHDYRFDTEYKSRGCNNAHILSHKQSVIDMFQKHNNLQKTGKLCIQELQQRRSFKYNWKVPPSQCCIRVRGIP